jgi:hypothetical protein
MHVLVPEIRKRLHPENRSPPVFTENQENWKTQFAFLYKI